MEKLSVSSPKGYLEENNVILKGRAKGYYSALDQISLVYEDDSGSCGWMKAMGCEEGIWRE